MIKNLINFLKSTPSWGPAELMSTELKPMRKTMATRGFK